MKSRKIYLECKSEFKKSEKFDEWKFLNLKSENFYSKFLEQLMDKNQTKYGNTR